MLFQGIEIHTKGKLYKKRPLSPKILSYSESFIYKGDNDKEWDEPEYFVLREKQIEFGRMPKYPSVRVERQPEVEVKIIKEILQKQKI